MDFTLPDNSCSWYIHWPFCRTRCSYCPFIALAGHEGHMRPYNQALLSEITRFIDNNPHCKINTIYIGGGTPSTWPAELLLDISDRIKNVHRNCTLEEITIEVNPTIATKEQLVMWRQWGINRLSIGVQYCDDAILATLNRFQVFEDVVAFINAASKVFDNISVDLMLGLPGVDREKWENFLKMVVKWPIKHISLYCLTLHELTPLYYAVRRGDITLPDDDTVADAYLWTCEFLESNGFEHYEISNFARPCFKSRHNCIYWDRKPYKGFGIGSCSFDGVMRSSNEQNIERYIHRIAVQKDATVFQETLTHEAARIEIIMLGLRQAKGVERTYIFQGVSRERACALETMIDRLSKAGFLVCNDNRVTLTRAGFVVEQEIITQLVLKKR